MKSTPVPLPAVSACPREWNQMGGDERKRFCEHCQLHVHNLSAMADREREDFLAEAQGRSCITYQVKADGTMVTPSRWARLARPLHTLARYFPLIAVPLAMTSCKSRRTLGEPLPPGGSAAQSGEAGQRPGQFKVEPPLQRMTGTPLPPTLGKMGPADER